MTANICRSMKGYAIWISNRALNRLAAANA